MTRILPKFLLLLLVCTCLLCSCRRRAEFSGGQTLSDEEAREMLSALQEEPSAEEAVYYFVTGSGTVYHSSASCTYLKNSGNVQTGSLSQALAAGKERLCSACAKAGASALTTDNADPSRACYYTASGSVWHYDNACVSLAHSENVISGTVEQAMQDGKARACARCGNE